MSGKYKVRYEIGDKAIEISRNRGIRILVDCDDVEWSQPDPRAVAEAICAWMNSVIRFPTLKQAERERAKK